MEKQVKSKFKKFLIIYVIVLIVLMIIFLGYVADSLIKYENNQIENYMQNMISDLKKASKHKKIEKYIDITKINISEFEKEDTVVDEGFFELLNTSNIKYKLNNNTTEEVKPIYDIYTNEQKILEVQLDGTNKESRLGLLTFNKWKINKIEPKLEKGLYCCEVLTPNNYTVYINDKKISDEYITEEVQNESLEQISKYAKIPNIIKYKIPDLIKMPDIKILDEEGNEADYKQEGNIITKQLDFKSVQTEDEASQNIDGKIDVLKVARDWSLYLTDDLTGRLHGFYNIKQYLIQDSNIEKFAYSWATGIDITFVSSHRLDNPTFTNEQVSNFEIYSKNAFSCEVNLQKNLILKSGKKIEDKMSERMYFVYYDETNDGIDNPSWKLVNMQSVTNNNQK